MPLEAGQKVGRYTIARLLAQGGMAEVYRAEQALTPGISRPVAVKVIRPEYSESQDFREMFLDEARTACTLSHPNIVHIYEVGETDDGLLYMAMELVAGETLATINRTLRDHGERFSDDALFAVGVNTCSALEAVHALRVEGGTVNLVHRDVSPHNLLLASTGALKLIDFGIAKAATNRNLTMPGVTKGKAGYFSPEQAMGKKLDGRSDLFSLGVTLYKLASGETPFDDHKNHAERHAALVRGQWKPLEATYPGMPPGFYEVVDRALHLKPEERYQTAREMREALERAAFDAQLRVGQSSLQGYVDDQGEITETGGGRSSSAPNLNPAKAAPSLTNSKVTRAAFTQASTELKARATPYDPHTEKVAAPKRSRTTRALLGVAFVAAVVIGVAGTLLLLGGKDERVTERPLEPPRVAEPVKPADPGPGAVEDPAPGEPAAEPTPDDTVVIHLPDPDGVPAAPPRRPKEHRPKNPVVAQRPPDKGEPGEKPDKPSKLAEEPEPAIPAGQGKLRIGATDADAVAGILVGKEDWGSPPVDRRVSSGTYTVVLKLADGRKSSSWKGPVMPDRTTVLVYDVATEKWSVK